MVASPTYEPTSDPEIFIEERRDNYVRYRRCDGRRWEVFGSCDQRGDCLIGAVVDGFGSIESMADIDRAKAMLGVSRLLGDLDVPVTPEFTSCCPFTYIELERR